VGKKERCGVVGCEVVFGGKKLHSREKSMLPIYNPLIDHEEIGIVTFQR
jgi:hypothetical protein